MTDPLTSLALIPAVGIGAQWLALRLGLPSILVLLASGLVLGAGFGVLHPHELFGEVWQPAIALAVGLVLFEGGLSLKRAELHAGGRVLTRLLTLGVTITFVAGTLLAASIVGIPFGVAAVVGALLVVTGPTVVGPLLASIRPHGAVGPILKAEGILVDPIGALLGSIIAKVVITRHSASEVTDLAGGVGRFLVVGLGIGLLGAVIAVAVLKRYLIPDGLTTAFALALAVLVIAGADELVDDSGLLAVTVMGMVIGSQQRGDVRTLLEFNETVRVLLIASLFVVLGAEVTTRDQLASIGWQEIVFVTLLIVVIRPVVVALSTAGSELRRQQRIFLAWMAPRGIVAASTASLFAINLQHARVPGADDIVPVVFVTIVVTISVYGMTSGPLARRLGLAEAHPQGTLVLGANPLAVAMSGALHREGFRVLLVDTDADAIAAARDAGLEAHLGSLLSDLAVSEIDLRGIGRLLAVTANPEATALAALRFSPIFGRRDVYEVPVTQALAGHQEVARELHARPLETEGLGFTDLTERLKAGGSFVTEAVDVHLDKGALRARHALHGIPMFVVKPDHTLVVGAVDGPVSCGPGDRLISFVG